MRKNSISTNVAGYIAIGIIGIVGLVFFCVGLFGKINADNFMATAEKTEAYISDIQTYTTRGKKGKLTKHYKVYVDYVVDDIEYSRVQLGSYNSSMRIGKTIEIYYDPTNPKEIMADDSAVFIVPLCVGSGLLVLMLVIIVVAVKNGKKQKNLIANGVAYTGTIIDVREVTNVKVNGRHPFKADCEVVNPLTQERYLFSSRNISDDIRFMMGAPVVVYVDEKKPSNHFVDIEGAINDFYASRGTNDFRY